LRCIGIRPARLFTDAQQMTSRLTRLLKDRHTVLKPTSRSLVSTAGSSSLLLVSPNIEGLHTALRLLVRVISQCCFRSQARDWISESLYNLEHGYFNTAASPVGQLPDPLPLQQLAGQQAYLQTLRLWYDKLQVPLIGGLSGFLVQKAYAKLLMHHNTRHTPLAGLLVDSN